MNSRLILTALLTVTMGLTACHNSCDQDAGLCDLGEDYAIATARTEPSSFEIRCLAEDQRGQIWMGTKHGLNRYDGHEYYQYHNNQDSLSLPDNQVYSLMCDSRGRLWVGTVDGIAYYTEQDNFHRVPINDRPTSIGFQLVESPDSCILANLSNEVAVYDEEADRFHLVLENLTTAAYYTVMYFDPMGRLWHVGGNKVQCFQPGTRCSNFSLVSSTQLPFSITASCLTGDSLCVAGGHNGYMIDTRLPQGHIETKPLFAAGTIDASTTIDYMYPYESGLMLCTQQHGSIFYSLRRQSLYSPSQKGYPIEPLNERINCLMADSHDNLWIGTADQGCRAWHHDRNRFTTNPIRSHSMSHTSVEALAADSHDRIWIGTLNQGLMMLDPNTNQEMEVDMSELFGDPQLIRSAVMALHCDSKGDLWVLAGTDRVARCRYDAQTNRLKCLDQYECYMGITIGEDRLGNIWIGSYSNQLMYLAPESDHFETIYTRPNDEFSYHSSFINLPDGRFLASTWTDVLNEIDPVTKECRPLDFDPEDLALSIPRSICLPNKVMRGKNGLLWIGTRGNGMICYDIAQGKLSPVPGSPCSDVSSIEEDLEGNLWISTLYGITRFEPTTGEFTSFYAYDGIGGSTFYDRSSCRLSDGRLVFGSNSGITLFNPLEVSQTREVPILIEELKVNNKTVRPVEGGILERHISLVDEIELSYRHNNIALTYCAVDYNDHEGVRYSYKMEGLNDYWIDTRNLREAIFAGLEAGTYTFHVRVMNADNSYVMGERSLRIIVHPAPWLTWWAWLIYAAIAALSIRSTVTHFYRLRKARKEALLAKREQLHEERINKMNMQFFANVSHEFRSPLTMIAAPTKLLANDPTLEPQHRKLMGIVERSVNRMLRLVNQMLDFNKLENDTLRINVRQQEIIELLRGYVEMFSLGANEKQITISTVGLEDRFVGYVDSDVLENVCCNLLSNALKYTNEGGYIGFHFDVINQSMAKAVFADAAQVESQQWIRIDVLDSGIGIPAEKRERIFERFYQVGGREAKGQYNYGAGIGLYYARALAQLNHGFIKADGRPDGLQGSCFTVLLPVDASAFSPTELSATTEPATAVIAHPAAPQTPAVITADAANDALTTTTEQTESNDEDKPLVLVVDDDPDVVELLRSLLSPYYRTFGTFSADEAYTAVQNQLPDLVISDVMMPERDGFSLCRQLKEDLQLSHIPVILVTARNATADQVEGINCGAYAYVTKPFDAEYLLALIRTLLRDRQQLRQLLAQHTQTDPEVKESLSSQDEHFMDEFYALMEKGLADPDFDIVHIAESMSISRTKFYYKVKGLTGENPAAFFKRYRLNRAAELIAAGHHTMSEIACMTGFSTPSSFSYSFKKQFGVSPSDYKE